MSKKNLTAEETCMLKIIVYLAEAITGEDEVFRTAALEPFRELVSKCSDPPRPPTVQDYSATLTQLLTAIQVHLVRQQGIYNGFIERLDEWKESENKNGTSPGRPRGSLSSLAEPKGTTIDDVIDMLREAKRAREAQDGSFAELCRQVEIPESTMRSRVKNYADLIDRE